MKLKVSEFTGVKLKLSKKKNGDLFIDFTPIIKHANKLIKAKKARERYIVFYSQNASPMIAKFKTEKAAMAFAEKHEKLNVGEYPDNWVDCIVKGEFVAFYPNWSSSSK